MPAFMFEKLSPPKTRTPQMPAMPQAPRLPEWARRYRWPLAVLTMSLPFFLLLVAFKLLAGN